MTFSEIPFVKDRLRALDSHISKVKNYEDYDDLSNMYLTG